MKKTIVFFLVCLLCLGTAFAAGKSEGKSGKDLRIGVSMNQLDDFQVGWLDRFKAEAEAEGVELIIQNADGNADTQLTQVENLITLQPDAIFIKALDADAIVPAFEACERAGIPTIAGQFDVNYTNTLKLIISNYGAGVATGNFLADYLEKNPSKNFKIGYLWGMSSVPVLRQRYDGCFDTLKEKGFEGRYEILAEADTMFNVTNALNTMEDWVQAYKDMNLVIIQSDELALAAIQVLNAAGKGPDKCMVIGFNGSKDGCQALRDGSLAASAVPSITATLAKDMLDYAIRVAKGENLAGQTVDMAQNSAACITKDTVDYYEPLL